MFFECAGRPLEHFKGVDRGFNTQMDYRRADDQAYGTWGPGEECGPSTVMNCSNSDEIYSFHPGGAVFLLGERSVAFVTEDIDVDTFVSLFTRAGDDLVLDR